MSKYTGRKFQIIKVESENHFYGAKVGDVIVASDDGGWGRDIWADPAKNPCITEEGWKDLPHLCVAVEEELGEYIVEVFD